MAKCKLCDKWGLFLKLSSNGLCIPCETQFCMDLTNATRIMKESMKLMEHSKNYKTRISRCDVFMRHASVLAKYENKGLVATDPPPSVLIKNCAERKTELTNEYNASLGAKYEKSKRELARQKTSAYKAWASGSIAEMLSEIEKPCDKEEFSGIPRITIFRMFSTILGESGRYEDAIAVCRKALEYKIDDDAHERFEERIERLQKKNRNRKRSSAKTVDKPI